MRDVVAGPERVGDRVARGRVHRPEAEAAVERGEREPGAGLAVGAVAHGARQVAADEADAFERVEVDQRMRLAARVRLGAVRQRVHARRGGDRRRDGHRQVGIDDGQVGEHVPALDGELVLRRRVGHQRARAGLAAGAGGGRDLDERDRPTAHELGADDLVRSPARRRPARRRAWPGPSRCRRRSRRQVRPHLARRRRAPRRASASPARSATLAEDGHSPGRPSRSARGGVERVGDHERAAQARAPRRSGRRRRPSPSRTRGPPGGRSRSGRVQRVEFKQRGHACEPGGRGWRRGRARRACWRGRPGRCRRCRTPCRGRRSCGRTAGRR